MGAVWLAALAAWQLAAATPVREGRLPYDSSANSISNLQMLVPLMLNDRESHELSAKELSLEPPPPAAVVVLVCEGGAGPGPRAPGEGRAGGLALFGPVGGRRDFMVVHEDYPGVLKRYIESRRKPYRMKAF